MIQNKNGHKGKWLRWLGWVLPFLAILSYTLFLAFQMHSARDVVIAIQGYDPRSLLSGHYIHYQIDWKKTDCNQFAGGICPKRDFDKIPHRYYIPQQEADRLNQLLLLADQNNVQFEIIFAYEQNRAPIARALLINNQEWQQYLMNNKK